MVSQTAVAWAFLGYLLAPVVILFLFWLAGWIRRRFFHAGEEAADDRESET